MVVYVKTHYLKDFQINDSR